LGPYEITGAIGAGGMGEVYRAHDPKLGRDVAIKVLPEAFAHDAERMARFQREAKVLASLDHPNIASIYGLEDSGGTRALVMQLVEGPTLADRIRFGPIPVDEAVGIARQIADALEYAHERGIIHRDLKPANVKVTNDDVVKVLDFGLAKALEGDSLSLDISTSPTISRMATQQGVLLGTAAYMSPEQAKAKSVDRRADIWAFGCVLYEMLTGKVAFPGDSVTDTLAAVIRAESDWSLLPANTPMRIRVLLQRCLQKDPKQRLRDIGDARISLDEVLSGGPDSAPTVAAPVPIWHRSLPWAVAALALVTLGPIALLNLRQSGQIRSELMRLEIPLPEKTTMSINGTFAVSPDGRQLAFAAQGTDGISRLWIRPLGSLEARPLLGTEAPQFPPFFWSPDSRFVAFDASGKLKNIDVSGGPRQTLCDLPATAVGGSWNSDGVIIFAQAPGPVMRIPAGGGNPTPLTAFGSKDESGHLFPSFLPDGRHFLYGGFSRDPSHLGFFVGSLDAKPEEQNSKPFTSDVESNYVAPSDGSGQVLFIRDGALQAQPFDMRLLTLSGEPVTLAEHVGTFGSYGFFSASHNGVLVYRTGGEEQDLQLTWFDREGNVLTTAGEPRSFMSAALSPDGRRVAFSAIGANRGVVSGLGLWFLDLSRGTSARFTFGPAGENPVWSPDGSQIIFGTRGSGLYEKLASGVSEEQLILKSTQDLSPTSWSHDGRFLLYTAVDPKTKDDLWILPLEGDRKPFPFLHTEFAESDGRFSPDGHWVAYTSDESGRSEIYVRSFSPSTSGATSNSAGGVLISSNGGTEPRWRGDGRELFYRGADRKLMAVELTLTPAFQAGLPKVLFRMPEEGGPSAGRPMWDATPDGKRFLLPVPQSSTTPFTVVLNWPSLLKK